MFFSELIQYMVCGLERKGVRESRQHSRVQRDIIRTQIHVQTVWFFFLSPLAAVKITKARGKKKTLSRHHCAPEVLVKPAGLVTKEMWLLLGGVEGGMGGGLKSGAFAVSVRISAPWSAVS